MTARIAFPHQCRCIVFISLDYDGTAHEVGRGLAPIGLNSWGRYVARRGVPRYLDMLEKHGVPATFFVSGYDAEQSPDLVREIDRRGFEVAAHGYLHEGWELPEDEETMLLRRTDRILSDLLGKQIDGWRAPGGRKSTHTMRTLKSLGYLYDSSDKDYDLPYKVRFGKEAEEFLIALPNNACSLEDFSFYKLSLTPPGEVLQHWRSEFDAIYRAEGFFVLTLHPRAGWGSGSPARSRIVDELIAYIKTHDEVEFFSARQLASWFASQHEALDEVPSP